MGIARRDLGLDRGRSWFNGGSPTQGFLGNIDHGPIAATFRGQAVAGWADWLFMLGLLGIGVALLLGIGLRIGAVAGTLMMCACWARAEWPLDRFTDAGEPTMSTNPILDYHVVYALVLIGLAIVAADNVWSLGKALVEAQRHREEPMAALIDSPTDNRLTLSDGHLLFSDRLH